MNPTATRKPAAAVRIIGWSVLVTGLALTSAAAVGTTDPTPREATVTHTERLLADHDCDDTVTSGATGVVIESGVSAVYQAGADAASVAYQGHLDGTVHVIAFCRS